MSEEFFGPTPQHPHRPDHPDLDRMLEIVLQLDGQAVEAGRRFEEIIAEVVDPRSLAYLATQRAFRVLGIQTASQLAAQATDVARLASVYHEAFVVGYRFRQRGGHRRG